MRSIFFACVISLAACAHSAGPRPINVHAVRTEIKGEITASPGDAGPRSIVSMGKVTSDSAVIYTDSPSRSRREETWVRGPSGWTLTEAKLVGATTTTSSAAQ